MVYRYDYDVKNELIDLLETKQDFFRCTGNALLFRTVSSGNRAQQDRICKDS